jgi:hypothetical protein
VIASVEPDTQVDARHDQMRSRARHEHRMRGAIDLFKAIDPNVGLILTFQVSETCSNPGFLIPRMSSTPAVGSGCRYETSTRQAGLTRLAFCR